MQALRRRALGVWLIAIPFVAAMIAIVPVDHDWTVALTQLHIPAFVNVMRRTVFEGGSVGGSDFSILLFLSIIVLYLRSCSARASERLIAWRPALGYLFVSALAAGLGAIHTVKWIMGRPRPWSVLGREHLPYSEWYQVGAHYISEGVYRGSFPSGHTAAVFILMALVYVLYGDPSASAQRRGWCWVLGALVLAYTAAMGLASAMARSHWLSDAIASTGLVWVLIHVLYFRVLRVPEQQAFRLRRGQHLALKSYWELRLCAWGFLALLGFLAAALGVRAFWAQSPPTFALLIPVGIALWWPTFPRARALVTDLHAKLAEAAR